MSKVSSIKAAEPVSWKPTTTAKESRLSDETVELVVDAYLKGKKDGYKAARNADTRAMSKTFQGNLDRAMMISSKLLREIEDIFSVEMSGLYLKIEDKFSFTAALIIPQNLYYSKNRRQLTELLIKAEVENCEDLFGISFTILPAKESLNLRKLFLNGFIFQYAPKH